MESQNVTFRVPVALGECLPKRLQELGMTRSEYLLSLIRYDLSIAKPHHTTGDFHRLTFDERDRIDREIAKAYQSGESLGGSWFENRVKEAAKELSLPQEPAPSKVGEKLRKRLRSGK